MAFVVAVVGFLFVVPFCGAAVMYEQVFGKRTEISDSPLLPKFEDFSDMDRRQVRFPSNRGQMLTGYVYSAREDGDTKPKGLVVLSHGLGGGHSSYLYEIDYFVGQGYDVFAYDNTGCYESEGDDMVGLVQSCIDLDYALRYVESDPMLSGPTVLYGHSWGGYAVAAVLNYGHDVAAIVSRSGFNRSQDMLIDQGVSMVGNVAKVLSPYMRLYEMIKFGRASGFTGVGGIDSSDADVMIIQSSDDQVVKLKDSIYGHLGECTRAGDVETILFEDKGHDVVVSYEAMAYIAKREEEAERLKEMFGGYEQIPEGEVEKYYQSADKKLTTELDREFMDRISAFFDRAVGAVGSVQ